MLDTGSTSTFISDKLATQLDLNVTASHVNLKTLNSSTSKDTDVVNVSVDSLDHKFHIDMKNVYVVHSIPTKPFYIDVDSYSHLKDIDVTTSVDHDVNLLIGQEDYASCFVPLDVRKGRHDEPYAVRTPLGYIVNGTNNNYGYQDTTVLHPISAFPDGIQH